MFVHPSEANMKILRTIESFYPYVTGPGNQAFMISKELENKGISSPVFTTDKHATDSPESELIDGVNIKRFKVKAKFMKFFYTPDMKESIIDEKPEIIHAHNYRSYQTNLSYNISRKLGIPFVINTHGSLLGYETITRGVNKLPYKAFDILKKKTVLDASAVIVSSRQEKEEALEFGVDEEKIYVIPMGIDVDHYDSIRRKRKDDKVRLLFVGRICRDRNIKPILKALKRAHNENIELRVVGGEVKRSDTEKDGYLDELKSYAEKHNLNVTFPGPIYGKDLIREYKDADIFIYTSLWENFGQAMLEAAASGLPIIATPVGIAEDIIKHGETGYIIDFEELDYFQSLKERINSLLDPKKRKAFGSKMKKIIRQDYQWEDITMEYEKMYLKVSGK